MSDGSKPTNVAEFFDFYYDRFKPIYCHVESLNQPPVEMLFEVNAAFDHISRFWYYQEDEKVAVDRASGHLKRGCFDGCKIILRETRDQYEALMGVDISVIDNGAFERDVIHLWAEIEKGAREARASEGDSRDDTRWDDAFDRWEAVYAQCVHFQQDFFLSDSVQWARTKERKDDAKKRWRSRVEGIGIGLATAAIVWLVSTVWTHVRSGGRERQKQSGSTKAAVAPATGSRQGTPDAT